MAGHRRLAAIMFTDLAGSTQAARAVAERSANLAQIIATTFGFETLRSDPRFVALAERIGHPAARVLDRR